MLAVTIYGDDGKTAIDWRLCLVPKSDYTIHDTWYAMGMVGTGSKDIEAKEIFVPERRALEMAKCKGGSGHPGGEVNPGTLYKVALVAAAGHPLSATALGTAEGAYGHVKEKFTTRLGPSLTVLLPLLLISTILALGAAMLVAYLRGSLTDRAIMVACTIGQSVSILVYILVLQYWLAYQLGWFPVQGWGSTLGENLLAYAALPVLVGVIVSLAPDIRLYRSVFLEEINQDYVRTARAKGLGEGRVMWLHVLRNAAIPITTNVMTQIPGLLAGAFLIERFFSIPGIGREVILAVERSDFPVIKAVTIYVAIATMIVNLLADLTYRALDPRVQLK
jgi:peptide/nickel transport system permease protein